MTTRDEPSSDRPPQSIGSDYNHVHPIILSLRSCRLNRNFHKQGSRPYCDESHVFIHPLKVRVINTTDHDLHVELMLGRLCGQDVGGVIRQKGHEHVCVSNSRPHQVVVRSAVSHYRNDAPLVQSCAGELFESVGGSVQYVDGIALVGEDSRDLRSKLAAAHDQNVPGPE